MRAREREIHLVGTLLHENSNKTKQKRDRCGYIIKEESENEMKKRKRKMKKKNDKEEEEDLHVQGITTCIILISCYILTTLMGERFPRNQI